MNDNDGERGPLTRRQMLTVMGATGAALVSGCQPGGTTTPPATNLLAAPDPPAPPRDPTFAWLKSRIMQRHGVVPFGYIRSEGLSHAGGKLVSWAPFAGSGITLGTMTAAALGTATPDIDPVTGDVLTDGDTTRIESPLASGLSTYNRPLTIYRLASQISGGYPGLQGGTNYLSWSASGTDPSQHVLVGRSFVSPQPALDLYTFTPVDNEDIIRVVRITKDATTGVSVRAIRYGRGHHQPGYENRGVGPTHAHADMKLFDPWETPGSRIFGYVLFAAAPNAEDDLDVNAWAERYANAYGYTAPLLWTAGDSITAGQGAALSTRYADATWKTIGTRYDYLNTGVGGGYVPGMQDEAPGGQLDRFKVRIGKQRRRIVAITQSTINDLSRGDSADAILTNLRAVWARYRAVARAAGYTPGTNFFIVHMMPSDDGGFTTPQQAQRARLKNLLVQMTGVWSGPNGLGRVDLTTVDSNAGGNNSTDYSDDKHPNATGQAKMAAKAAEAILALP